MTTAAYPNYAFTVQAQGDQLMLQFTIPGATGTYAALYSTYYVNVNNLCMSLSRYNANYVNFADTKGSITVDCTKCTSPVYTGPNAQTWVNTVLNLI